MHPSSHQTYSNCKMRPKANQALSSKVLLLGVFLAFLLLFVLRSRLSLSKENPPPTSRTIVPKASHSMKQAKTANYACKTLNGIENGFQPKKSSVTFYTPHRVQCFLIIIIL